MHTMVVLYPMPDNTAAFRAYYEGTHLPLVAKLPGIRSMKHAYEVGGLGGESSYFAIFEGEFDPFDALQKALGSPEGKAVGPDGPNYATGGAKIIHYEVLDGGPSKADPDPPLTTVFDAGLVTSHSLAD